MRLLILSLLLLALAVPAVPAAAATDGYEQVVDITFPLDPGEGAYTYTDTYHASRGGGTRVHQATDIMAPSGRKVYAAQSGTITWITGLDGPPPSYGYMISIAGDDGRDYAYVHLGTQDGAPSGAYAPGMAEGVRVERGQWIGINGCSGNASCSAPHLHLEIFDPDLVDPALAEAPYKQGRLNPYPSLLAAEERGDYPGTSPADRCLPDGSVASAPVGRVGGADRIATAAAASAHGWPAGAHHAVLATARTYPDALAGAALAATHDAPLLLTERDALPKPTADELRRLGAGTVWVLGGEAAVQPAVVDALAGLGVQVRRLGGVDRYATAALVAREVGAGGGEVALALGYDAGAVEAWPGAVAAGALADVPAPRPVLLTPQDALPAPTAEALRAVEARRVLIVGGTAGVSQAVADRLVALGLEVERIDGADRYATSVALAQAARTRGAGSAGRLVLASGAMFPDGLAAGALTARLDATLLLAPPCALEQAGALEDYLAVSRVEFAEGLIVGGPVAVSERVRWQVNSALTE